MNITLLDYIRVVTAAFLILGTITIVNAATPWGANYFPNVPLVTHEGKTVHFFDDLIKDKVVAINFIYTHCADSCPLETAQLIQVQKIMGDRLGKDVFFYSITIDPENDTPDTLKEYKEKFNAKWTFLTGKKEDIILLRKKLGLYIEEIQDGSNNHNVSLIIGNQTTGRWMKRSPFENPYVLADQIGNWLTGWKAAPKIKNYANAPTLRNIPRGEQIYRTRCATCHSLNGKELAGALGPDLIGVTERREKQWLLDWLKAPDQMLKKKDPIAMALFRQYNELIMPNMRLKQEEAQALLKYIDSETKRLTGSSERKTTPNTNPADSPDSHANAREEKISINNSWIRETESLKQVKAGLMTRVNSGSEHRTRVNIESEAFNNIDLYRKDRFDGLLEMQEVNSLDIPANSQLQFDPEGNHLMLLKPKAFLAAGQQVDVTLTFKSGIKKIDSFIDSFNVAAR